MFIFVHFRPFSVRKTAAYKSAISHVTKLV
ncbi:hypothetical protein TSMEX_006514, partial [Taenia solium]